MRPAFRPFFGCRFFEIIFGQNFPLARIFILCTLSDQLLTISDTPARAFCQTVKNQVLRPPEWIRTVKKNFLEGQRREKGGPQRDRDHARVVSQKVCWGVKSWFRLLWGADFQIGRPGVVQR